MISEHWQTVLAIVCVAGALLVLIRRAVGLFGGSVSGSCGTGGCGSCENAKPAAESHRADGFVSVDVLTSDRNSPTQLETTRSRR